MSAPVKNIFVASVVSAVFAAVIGGIVLLGSPAKERTRKLDERRVENLRAITNAVNLYWTRHKSLPPSLDALSREPGVLLKPLDPETGQPYEYKTLGEKNYELCARFALDTAEEQDSIRKEFWSHGAGRQCFHFEVREAKQ
jgi:hypothetical protein